ncbi:MAG: hypothetical protein HIU85_02670 [Proteobacteria bacterium]|nr:hypothetical protein [Pseudomonadota bacterium]
MRTTYRRMMLAAGLAVLSAAAALACAATAAVPTQTRKPSAMAGLPPASLGGPCLRSRGAFLRAQIRGAVRADIDLRGRELKCEGGPRLDGRGIRMGFEGRAARLGRVRMIFGIDGVKEGRPGRELPTNLTVILEDEKLLFATQGDGNCTVDRLTQEPLNGRTAPTRPARTTATTRVKSTPAKNRYRVVAHGFCIAPANDLSGRRRIMVTTFDFSGRADFQSP